MKVALVNPGKNSSISATHPPMHLGYIAAYLEKHGVEVHIIDELAGQNVKKAFERLMPDIVGITATTPMAPDAYRVAKLAREMGFYTVMGGKHAMILPDEALQHVDTVVLGEGERAMLEIVNGNRSRIVKVDYVKNIDELPSPAWHLMDMDFYFSCRDRNPDIHINFIPPGTRTGALIATRGCPYTCIFCYNSWRDAPVRAHSPERVVEDIKHLIDKYGMQALFFMDDDLFANKKRLRELCELIKKEKINIIWGCQSTADHVDLEHLKLVKEAGCLQVGFGFESGSQRILDILKKERTTVEQNARAVELCREAGVLSWATFMVGNPTETVEDMKQTFDFIKKYRPDGIGVHVTTPFPGTELWRWCEGRGLIPKNIDWSIFTTGQVSIPACDTIPPEVVQEWRDRIHYYFYPPKLSKTFKKVWNQPSLIFQAILSPGSTFKRLYNKFRQQDPYIGLDF